MAKEEKPGLFHFWGVQGRAGYTLCVFQSSPFSLEVLRVLAEVHRQLPVTGPLHFYLQQSNVCWKSQSILSSLHDLHIGCFRWKR